MKKLKEITKRIATLGLTAALMVNSFPATAFAAEIGDPDLAVVMEEEQQEGGGEILTDESESDAAVSDEDTGSAAGEGNSDTAGSTAEGSEKSDDAVTPSTAAVSEDSRNEDKKQDSDAQDGETETDKDAAVSDSKSETGKDAAVSDSKSETGKDAAVSDGDTKEEKDAEEKSFPAFKESKSIDGVRITVEADEGVFPKGATLSVKKVTLAQEKQAEEAVESERDEDKQVAASYTYDIKVLDQDGNELQPADESKVKVSFKLEEVADSNLETNIYHIKEADPNGTDSGEKAGNDKADSEETSEASGADSDNKASDNIQLIAEKLPVETDGDTAIAETDGFSLYTVEFTYDNKQYVLPGDSEVALSEILDTVGLTGEVSAVEVSDENLFSAKKCRTVEDGSTPEEDEDGKWVEDENGTWFVFAHKAFSTEEWMKVTIGGVVYEITVTDTNGEQSVTYTISHVAETGHYIYSLVGSDGSSGVLYDAKGNRPTKVTLDMGDDITFVVDAGEGSVFYCDYKNEDYDMLGFTDYLTTNDYDFTITSKTRIIQHVQIDGKGYINFEKAKTTLEADGNDKTITVRWEGGEGGNRLGAPGKFIVTFAPPAQTYNINYVLNGGTNASGNPSTYADNVGVSSFAAPTREHYTFGGWYDNASCTGTPVTSIPAGSSGNKTLYAKWTINKYTVTWKDSDGTTIKADTVEYGKTPSYSGATPTKAGDGKYSYTFKGWSPSITSVTGAATYTAVYTKAPITTHFSQRGSTYTIHDAVGWEIFCECLQDVGTYNHFSGKTVALGDDISVTTMAGSSDNHFCGTFDGNGKTLTVRYDADEDYAAPFRYADDGCVIENLHVAGTIATSYQFAAGVIGEQYGTVIIRNCRVSVTIESSTSGDGTHGGFVGIKGDYNDACLTIEGCVFDGRIVSAGSTATTDCGGFVGWTKSKGSLTITNSLYAPAADANAVRTGATFARNWTMPGNANCYYTAALGSKQGKQAYAITAGENVTVANAGTVTTYNVSGITSYGTGIKYNDVLYAGAGEAVSLTLGNTPPSGKEFGGYCVTNASGEDITESALDGTTLTMPASNVTVSAVFKTLHTHSFTYYASGATITATCSDTDGNCPLTDHKAVLTIDKPEKSTYGDEKSAEATLTGDTDVLGELAIIYAGSGSTTYAESSAAPTDAGTYTASVTVGSKTARVSYTIARKPVSITGLSASDKEYDGTTAATVMGTADIDGKVENDDVSVSAGTAAFADANAGTGKTVTFSGYSLSGMAAGNYTLSAQPAAVTADITPKSITGATVSLSAAQKEYTGSEQSVSVTGVILDGKTLTAGDYEVTGDTSGTVKNTYTVTVSGKGNYKDSATATWAITDKPMTVSAPDVTVTYDGQPHGIIVSVSDPVNGAATIQYGENEGSYNLEASPVITNASDSPKTVYFKVTADNYAEYTGSATVTINKKPVTVTGIKASDKTYDGTTAATIDCTAAIFDGKVESDELTVTADGAFADANAGMGKTVNISNLVLGGAAVGNYKLAESGQQKTARATISKADIPTEQITEPTAKTGLTYTGSAQELIGAGNVAGSIGTMYYAVTATDIAPADNLYTTSIPTATNAGTYYVWYKVKGNDNYNDTEPESVSVNIARAVHRNEVIPSKTKYGLSESVDIFGYIEEGSTVSGNMTVSGNRGIFEEEPQLNDKVISYKLKNVSENTGEKAYLTVKVSGTNYEDYDFTVQVEVINCDHSNRKLVEGTTRAATCTEQGYTGDYECLDCHSKIQGEKTPIDPDNHDFDGGVEVKPPTAITKGETKYTCRRCHKEKIVADIPCKEEEGKDYEDLRKDIEGLSGNAAPSVETEDDGKGNEVTTISINGTQVEEVVKDQESGKETVKSVVWIGGLKDSYRYTCSAIRPSFHVYDGTRKLKENTDYKVKWTRNKEVGTAEITVKFKGNYKDTKSETVKFEIKPAILGEDIIAHETGVAVKKSAQKPVPVLTWKETGKTVPAKNFNVTYNPSEVKTAGTYAATITSKNTNFDGTATALVKVAAKDKVLSNVKVKFDPKSYNYTGKPIEPKYSLMMGTTTLTKDKDYRQVSLTGNTNPGTATIIFEAISGNEAGYVGSKTATFKISGKKSLKDAAIDVTCAESVPYAKGGAKAAITVTDKDTNTTLKEGVDYTLSYSKNKAVGTGAEVKVKGKGNYKDTVTKTFVITKQSLKALEGNIIVSDQFTTKSKLKAPSVTIIDIDGKKLSAKTDYTVGEPDFSAKGNTEDGGIVYITITGKGNYSDTESVKVSYHYMKKVSSNIGKTKAKTIKPQPYTGNAVKLSKADLTDIVYTGSKGSENYLKPGTDFTVISSSYSNNVKKGTAKVTIRGIGAYAGTKTLSFKIEQRKVDYKGALVGDSWK